MEPTLPLWRLHLLRAMYALMAVGLAVQFWPDAISPEPDQELYWTVTQAVLVAVSLLAILGLRYPARMLPLLMFELLWKAIWLADFWLRLWSGTAASEAVNGTWFACMMGVVLVPIVMPWRYVWRLYVRAPGDPWLRGAGNAQRGATRSAQR